LLIPNFVVLNVDVINSFIRSVFGLNLPYLMVKICLLVTTIFLLMLCVLLQLIIFLSWKVNLTLKTIGLFYMGILIPLVLIGNAGCLCLIVIIILN
jgi:hypothetical protein